MKSIDDLFSPRTGEDYQRDNFDSFIKKSGFHYLVPSIHIAGTNGKGSTANYLASIYEKAGYKVGLFCSPQLVDINEMISINHELIKDETIIDYIQKNKKLYDKYDLSFFEVMTHIAFSYFNDEKCDIGIIECGMGGEIDATNIFTPILSIITSISLEHTQLLGRSISEIALMKAGIIKNEVPVLVGQIDEDALSVINDVARERKSKLVQVSLPGNVTFNNGFDFNYLTYLNMHISSKAHYSVDDALFALDGVTILMNKYPVSIDAVKEGLTSAVMPARFETINESPLVIVDGAHNPEAMLKLAKCFEHAYPNKNIHTVFACFRDKNLHGLLSNIGEISADITLTTFDHVRARTYEDYFLFKEDYEFIENPIEAIKTQMDKYPDGIILVTGSLAFAGYIRDIFKRGDLR